MSERRVRLLLPLLIAVLLVPAAARAQEDDEEEYQRFALGIGAGLVDSGQVTSPYLTASLRIRLGDEDQHSGSGIAAYVEPEVGYWDDDVDDFGSSATDALLGVNIGGSVALRTVQYFVGAGLGVHFLDTELASGVDESETSLGVNAHFGVDVAVGESMSLFGVGRVDLVDELEEDRQVKVYLGARFRF